LKHNKRKKKKLKERTTTTIKKNVKNQIDFTKKKKIIRKMLE
jgi:hypothetical protein